jgi:thymidine kinase
MSITADVVSKNLSDLTVPDDVSIIAIDELHFFTDAAVVVR